LPSPTARGPNRLGELGTDGRQGCAWRPGAQGQRTASPASTGRASGTTPRPIAATTLCFSAARPTLQSPRIPVMPHPRITGICWPSREVPAQPSHGGGHGCRTHYETEDAVSRNGSSFLCIQAHFSHEPPNSNYWNVIAQKGDTGVPGPQGRLGRTRPIRFRSGWFRCPATLGRYFVELKFPPKSVKFWVSEGSPEAQRYFACCQGMMDDHENQNCMTWAAEENRVVGASRTDLCIYTLSPSGREEGGRPFCRYGARVLPSTSQR